jgi:hypothetical protein
MNLNIKVSLNYNVNVLDEFGLSKAEVISNYKEYLQNLPLGLLTEDIEVVVLD